MGRRSTFTPAQKRDAVLGVLTKRKRVAETCRELGVSEQTFAQWREQAVEGMELVLADKTERDGREALPEKKLSEAERTIGRLARERSPGKSVQAADVSAHAALGRKFRAEGVAPVVVVAVAVLQSPEALYDPEGAEDRHR